MVTKGFGCLVVMITISKENFPEERVIGAPPGSDRSRENIRASHVRESVPHTVHTTEETKSDSSKNFPYF